MFICLFTIIFIQQTHTFTKHTHTQTYTLVYFWGTVTGHFLGSYPKLNLNLVWTPQTAFWSFSPNVLKSLEVKLLPTNVDLQIHRHSWVICHRTGFQFCGSQRDVKLRKTQHNLTTHDVQHLQKKDITKYRNSKHYAWGSATQQKITRV